MDGRSSLGLLGISGVALLLGALAACAVPATEETQGTSSSVTERPFDRHEVLDDASMRDSAAMSIADVQKFLDKTPWGTRSALAQYEENGKSAAAIMVEAAKAQGINPLEMIVRVQMEQGLVSKTTAAASTIEIAFGCGCPHSPLCSDKYRGFGNQAACAAGTMRRSMDRATTSTGTASGWKRGSSKTTEDGIAIVPRNAVTAALYTYTPWVGEAGGGRTGVGGVSLHAQVWDRFAEAVSYGAWATQSEGQVEQQADAGTQAPSADAAAPQPEPDPAEDPAPSDPDPAPAPAPTADAGSGTGTGTIDAGPPVEDNTESQGAPNDGSEDGEILSQGSTPPSSNAPPPKTSSRSPSSASPRSGADEASPADTANQGCSSSGRGGAPNGLLIAAAAALALVGARRRRTSR